MPSFDRPNETISIQCHIFNYCVSCGTWRTMYSYVYHFHSIGIRSKRSTCSMLRANKSFIFYKHVATTTWSSTVRWHAIALSTCRMTIDATKLLLSRTRRKNQLDLNFYWSFNDEKSKVLASKTNKKEKRWWQGHEEKTEKKNSKE